MHHCSSAGAKASQDSPHVVEIGEDESLFELEATGNDIGNVGQAKLVVLLESDLLPRVTLKKELFVVCHVSSIYRVNKKITGDLDHKRHVKYILQPAETSATPTERNNPRSEAERNLVTHVHRIT